MSFPLALFVTVLLLIGSGFFVAAEFALVAAKRHRMEQAVARGQRGAKAALAGMRELSLMLAGAQLGITICTLGLGSVSKPAISHELDPLLEKLGLPAALSYGIAFALAMIVVVFLHMVVGEMAPKSWAIAHPERSAMLLSPAFRAVVSAVRPLIRLMNWISNGLVRLCRVTPRDELTSVHNRDQLTHLIEESERLGLISKGDSGLMTRSLTEPQAPVSAVQIPAERIVTVPADAGLDEVLATAAEADRTRLLVRDGERVLGSVHARDALVARARSRAVLARDLARPVPELAPEETAAHAVEQLRERRATIAVVRDGEGRLTGLVSLDDLLARLLHPQAPPEAAS
ncbi:hemolysin family protein [Streptomyces rubiginosohelvolus]|uniref:hemolysin family protein n=1 Tax=Streptomyces TaxID=1883 RepID=UPI00190A4513|nr:MULTISPECIES: hemolysin family protein [unclassified Streptomyces]MBK3532478.1 HlyC/CorC family transporter [Streptomyces sp. MBT72]MBK3537691.1 HlyC/CorC family transporter [Streptomyces sp. MBT67]MBK3551634.1 HlyC/CorC family transporter [Streptomyces sp. MBT61]MBK6030418.1 HlyC/CorC family transporter [Streptomyces sp. MBT59]